MRTIYACARYIVSYMLPRVPPSRDPIDEEEAAFREPKPAGAYYRTQAPLYHYRDAPSGDLTEDAGAFVGLMVCLCLLLLLAFSVSYPLSNYYSYAPEHPPTAWTHGNEMYVRPP